MLHIYIYIIDLGIQAILRELQRKSRSATEMCPGYTRGLGCFSRCARGFKAAMSWHTGTQYASLTRLDDRACPMNVPFAEVEELLINDHGHNLALGPENQTIPELDDCGHTSTHATSVKAQRL